MLVLEFTYECPAGHWMAFRDDIPDKNEVYCNRCSMYYPKTSLSRVDKPTIASDITTRDPLLAEREKTHGSFSNNARMWERLYQALNSTSQFTVEQRLALAMIFLKIARAHDNPKHRDHWNDIAGYAKLGAEACDG